MRVKINLACSLALLILMPYIFPESLYGDDVNNNTDDYARGLQSHWGNISSLSGHITVRGTHGFSSDANAAPANIKIKINKVENGKVTAAAGILSTNNLAPLVKSDWRQDISGKFRAQLEIAYPTSSNSSRPTLTENYIDAWDGQTYSGYRGNSSHGNTSVTMQKKFPINCEAISYGFFLTDPFQFLIPGNKQDNDNGYPSLQKLRDPATYARFLQLAKCIGARTVLKVNCTAFDIDGGTDPATDEPIIYRVYLDSNNGYFPVGWDRFNAKTLDLLEEYRVQEVEAKKMQTGDIYRYAKSSSFTYYVSSPVDKNQRVISVAYEEKIDSINLDNDPNFYYGVDPSIADYILDGDTGTVIHVPR